MNFPKANKALCHLRLGSFHYLCPHKFMTGKETLFKRKQFFLMIKTIFDFQTFWVLHSVSSFIQERTTELNSTSLKKKKIKKNQSLQRKFSLTFRGKLLLSGDKIRKCAFFSFLNKDAVRVTADVRRPTSSCLCARTGHWVLFLHITCTYEGNI